MESQRQSSKYVRVAEVTFRDRWSLETPLTRADLERIATIIRTLMAMQDKDEAAL